MIESELKGVPDRLEVVPARGSGVITGLNVGISRNLNGVNDGDDVLSRVTIRLSSDCDELGLVPRHATFLLKFSHACILRIFTIINEATWERVHAFEGWSATRD